MKYPFEPNSDQEGCGGFWAPPSPRYKVEELQNSLSYDHNRFNIFTD